MRARLLTYVSLLFLGLGLVYGIYLLSYSQDNVGQEEKIAFVKRIQGEIKRRPFLQSEWFKVQVGDPLFDKDEIKTGSDSELLVMFMRDQNEIVIAENTTVELKVAAIKVNSGSVANQSMGENPFSIDAGDVQVLFGSREAKVESLRSGNITESIVHDKLNALTNILEDKEVLPWREEYLKLSHTSTSTANWNAYWIKLDQAYHKFREESQNVKISLDEKSGGLKAQVAEGQVKLAIRGQVGSIDVHEGEGLILNKQNDVAKRVKLLEAPEIIYPKDKDTVFNKTDVTLNWKEQAGAKIYYIEVSRDIEFKELIYRKRMAENQFKLSGLKYGMHYFWKLRAIDEYDFEGKAKTMRFSIEEDRAPPLLRVDDIKL